MDYKNFFERFVVSLLVLIIYLFLNYFFQYLIYYLILILYVIIAFEILTSFRKKLFIIILYLSTSFVFFIYCFSNDNLMYKDFNLLVLIIISFDTFSYIFGNYFGKIKILKNISPKKTFEGLIGGITTTYIFSYLYILFFNYNFNFLIFLFINIIIMSCFIGDLIESYFKRINNLKNSSNILPGHGGLFDRFDSFIFSIIPFSLLNNLML